MLLCDCSLLVSQKLRSIGTGCFVSEASPRDGTGSLPSSLGHSLDRRTLCTSCLLPRLLGEGAAVSWLTPGCHPTTRLQQDERQISLYFTVKNLILVKANSQSMECTGNFQVAHPLSLLLLHSLTCSSFPYPYLYLMLIFCKLVRKPWMWKKTFYLCLIHFAQAKIKQKQKVK